MVNEIARHDDLMTHGKFWPLRLVLDTLGGMAFTGVFVLLLIRINKEFSVFTHCEFWASLWIPTSYVNTLV
jgi:hypothetical protein